ncbi:hypothetical protein FRC10_001582 [Ceratobasidium sp. 414]|nr:hypothetical protein FRC10_001582 [Ceratobasidium sp. 414]
MTEIEEYIGRRQDLVSKERALRFDSAAISNATPQEIRATDIIYNLRAREAEEVWGSDVEKLTYPGMEFLVAKETIGELIRCICDSQSAITELLLLAKTQLYQVVRNMPKGALLHGHMDAMYDASFLYQLALEYPNMHVRMPTHITPTSPLPVPYFEALPPEMSALHKHEPSPTSPDYKPGTWAPLTRARQEFSLGGPEAFDKWIVDSMMINPGEAYAEFNTSAKASVSVTSIAKMIFSTLRRRFGKNFSRRLVSLSIMRHRPIAKAYMRQVMVSAVEDGISYMEIRFGFPRFGINEDGSKPMEHRDWLIIFGEAMSETRAIMKERGQEDSFIGAKIIYTALRFLTNEQMAPYYEDCMNLKTEFPDVIAGFDLVGHEDTGRPLIYYAESLLNFQAETKKRGLDIPFVFHAGETLDDGGATDSNLYDAILLGTKRIGHGFSLVKHPLLMQICKERGIAVEVCPISNEILRLTSSMPMHPLPVLLNNGLTVALCPDDPSIFGNMGLSFDFYQVIVASEITSILSLGQMARQSLQHSLLDPAAKEKAISHWEKRWVRFIDDIVERYHTGV